MDQRGDPDAALAFLREDYEWRKAEDAASLRSTPPEAVLGQDPAVLAEYYRRRCVGLDSAGRLTFYQAYACCVVKKLKTVVPLENVVKYHAWEQERACAMLDSLKRNGRGDGAMAVILDVAGMTIGKHINKDFIWLVKAIAAHDQAHYPERMGVTYIVNAPGTARCVRGRSDGVSRATAQASLASSGAPYGPSSTPRRATRSASSRREPTGGRRCARP